MDLAHPAIWVSDLDCAIEFYAAIGLERQWSFVLDGVENVYVGDEDGNGEVQLRYDPERTTPIAPNRADVDHLGFVVDDVDETYDAALAAGASEVSAPHEIDAAGAYAGFVDDLDGYTLEFIEALFED